MKDGDEDEEDDAGDDDDEDENDENDKNYWSDKVTNGRGWPYRSKIFSVRSKTFPYDSI